MIVALVPNALTSILHACNDEPSRLVTDQENSTQRKENQERYLINSIYCNSLEPCNEQVNWQKEVEHFDKKSNKDYEGERTIIDKY